MQKSGIGKEIFEWFAKRTLFALRIIFIRRQDLFQNCQRRIRAR